MGRLVFQDPTLTVLRCGILRAVMAAGCFRISVTMAKTEVAVVWFLGQKAPDQCDDF